MLTSGVCLYVLTLFCTTRIIYGQTTEESCSCSCDLPDPKFASGIKLLYYKCNKDGTNRGTIAVNITEPESLLNELEWDKRTIMYIFGLSQNPQVPNVKLIMKALCYGKTDNVVLLDWSKYSSGNYEVVFENAQKVGRLLARCIKQLKDNGLDEQKLYLIGFSIGSHIAGFTGKCNDFVIPRITGLDPAYPKDYPSGCYLTSTDAEWIDNIHTDMGGDGAFPGMGTADYIANNGSRPQPGCGLNGERFNFCSHQKSVRIYAKSKKHYFTAVKCPCYSSFKQRRCNSNLHTGVGYKATNVKGKYYFKTRRDV